jgi:hypothetical protein
VTRRWLLLGAVAAVVLCFPVADGASAPDPPTITGSTPTSPANNNSPLLSGTAAPLSTVNIFTDSSCATAPVATTTADLVGAFQVAVTVADDTSTMFHASATDATGTSVCSPNGFPYVEDSSTPAPRIDEQPADPSGSTNATFSFSDAESPVTFECRLDTASFSGCTSPKSYSALPDGLHTFQVRATDALGNVSAPTSYSWTVDTVHPLVTVTDKPPLLTNQTSASFSFSASPAPAGYECRLDGAAFAPCSSPKLYSGLGDGSHTFSVRTVSAGGTRGAATSYTWTVDTVAPQTAIAAAPAATSTSATATFEFTSTEAGSTFFCSLDASGYAPCTSPKTYSGLGDGTHAFRVQAVDAAGNADASAATYTWTITGVGPATVDLKPPANVSRLRRNVGYGRLQLRWRKPADPDFDHVGVYVSTSKRTAPRKLVYSGKAQSYTNRRFKNGAYYRYLIVSYDRAKNASGGSSTVLPPSALLRAPRNGSAIRRTPNFRWAAVRGASFYNIQLFHRGSKVLSAWPKRARQSLTRQWTYLGRRHALRKGAYVWYVWPAFGPRTKSRYGQLLGEGTFRVR